MPVTYPLSLPSNGIRRMTWRRRSVVGQARYVFTGKRQVQPWAGQWWEVDVDLPPMKRPDAEAWVAFLTALNGVEGTFLLGDSANRLPRDGGFSTGGVGYGGLVRGGGQTGTDLQTDGWQINRTNIMSAGDWLQLGTGANARLHKVLQGANSNASGEATLLIWPALRTSPADNSAVVVQNPVGLFALADNAQEWSIDEARIYGLSFSAVEVIA